MHLYAHDTSGKTCGGGSKQLVVTCAAATTTMEPDLPQESVPAAGCRSPTAAIGRARAAPASDKPRFADWRWAIVAYSFIGSERAESQEGKLTRQKPQSPMIDDEQEKCRPPFGPGLMRWNDELTEVRG